MRATRPLLRAAALEALEKHPQLRFMARPSPPAKLLLRALLGPVDRPGTAGCRLAGGLGPAIPQRGCSRALHEQQPEAEAAWRRIRLSLEAQGEKKNHQLT